MSEIELKALESRISDLIDSCSQLKKENQTLRAAQESLVSERASLIQKTEVARGRVEQMISRLRALEES